MIPYGDPGDPLRRRLGVAILGKNLRGSDALRGLALELEKTSPDMAAVYLDAARTLQAIELSLNNEFKPTESETGYGLPD